jgi:hypothetical protein
LTPSACRQVNGTPQRGQTCQQASCAPSSWDACCVFGRCFNAPSSACNSVGGTPKSGDCGSVSCP